MFRTHFVSLSEITFCVGVVSDFEFQPILKMNFLLAIQLGSEFRLQIF